MKPSSEKNSSESFPCGETADAKQVISNMANIRKTLARAASDGRHRAAHFAAARKKLDEIRSIVGGGQSESLVDISLKEISRVANEFCSDEDARAHVDGDPSPEFLKFEAALHASMRLKKNDVRWIVDIANEYMRKNSPTGADFPNSSSALVAFLEAQIDGFEKDLARVVETSPPRVEKKSAKGRMLGRMWLGFVGSTLSIANALCSLPKVGMPGAVATASMGTGVYALGAAVFNDATILKAVKNGKPKSSK